MQAIVKNRKFREGSGTIRRESRIADKIIWKMVNMSQ